MPLVDTKCPTFGGRLFTLSGQTRSRWMWMVYDLRPALMQTDCFLHSHIHGVVRSVNHVQVFSIYNRSTYLCLYPIWFIADSIGLSFVRSSWLWKRRMCLQMLYNKSPGKDTILAQKEKSVESAPSESRLVRVDLQCKVFSHAYNRIACQLAHCMSIGSLRVQVTKISTESLHGSVATPGSTAVRVAVHDLNLSIKLTQTCRVVVTKMKDMFTQWMVDLLLVSSHYTTASYDKQSMQWKQITQHNEDSVPFTISMLQQ